MKIIEKKKEEMQDYMGQVKTLLAKYTPPDPQKMEQAFKSGNASLDPNPAAQIVGLVFKNYAQTGDQMTLSFRHRNKESQRAEREHLFRRSEGRGDISGKNGEPARRHQLCAADGSGRDRQAASGHNDKF